MSHMKFHQKNAFPGIGDVGQNLFQAKVVLDKTYSGWTKPIPGIGFVQQNLFQT